MGLDLEGTFYWSENQQTIFFYCSWSDTWAKNIRVKNLAEATLMFVRFNALLRRKFSEPELCKMLEALGEMFNCGQEDLNQ